MNNSTPAARNQKLLKSKTGSCKNAYITKLNIAFNN